MKRLRRIIQADKEWRHWYDEQYRIDILGRQGTPFGDTNYAIKLDPNYFFGDDVEEYYTQVKLYE